MNNLHKRFRSRSPRDNEFRPRSSRVNEFRSINKEIRSRSPIRDRIGDHDRRLHLCHFGDKCDTWSCVYVHSENSKKDCPSGVSCSWMENKEHLSEYKHPLSCVVRVPIRDINRYKESTCYSLVLYQRTCSHRFN